MYEIGLPKNTNAHYSFGPLDPQENKLKKDGASTIAHNNNVKIAYRNMGYEDPGNFKKYSLTGVKSSINNDKPVQVSGFSIIQTYILGIPIYETGHSWVIDGYGRMKTIATDKYTKEPVTLIADYVHCKMGWIDKSCNGWYISGVFDVKNIPRSDTEGEFDKRSVEEDARFFQYDIQMLTNIKPK